MLIRFTQPRRLERIVQTFPLYRQIRGHLASVNRADNMGRDGGNMKTTDEKAEIPVSAEVEKVIRQRLESLDEDKKSPVDARQAVSEIRRNLKTPQPHRKFFSPDQLRLMSKRRLNGTSRNAGVLVWSSRTAFWNPSTLLLNTP
jgi:hypothetical protein